MSGKYYQVRNVILLTVLSGVGAVCVSALMLVIDRIIGM